jgi:hypothetical protein
MHNTMAVGLDKAYLRKLRIVMDPNIKKNKKRLRTNIRKGMTAMIEVAKLETELSSIAGRISPNDRFIMKKRIAQIMEEQKSAETVIPDMCETLTIGGVGAYEM